MCFDSLNIFSALIILFALFSPFFFFINSTIEIIYCYSVHDMGGGQLNCLVSSMRYKQYLVSVFGGNLKMTDLQSHKHTF